MEERQKSFAIRGDVVCVDPASHANATSGLEPEWNKINKVTLWPAPHLPRVQGVYLTTACSNESRSLRFVLDSACARCTNSYKNKITSVI